MKQPTPKDFRDLVGVPFMSGGRDPRLGLDCWGLFMIVQARFGHTVPEVAVTCAELLRINRTARNQIKALWRPAPGPGPGIAVVMATDHNHPDVIQHFGVCLDQRLLIHCLRDTGVVIDDMERLAGVLCIKGFYAWNG